MWEMAARRCGLVVIIAIAGWAGSGIASEAGIEGKAPGILSLLVDYQAALGEPTSCKSDIAPAIHAILVGASEAGAPFSPLIGPDHDVALLKASFLARDIPESNIVTLIGAQANRDDLAEAFVQVLRKINCGDRVWLHFGGNSAYSTDFAAMVLGEETPASFPTSGELWLALNAKVVGQSELVSSADISDFVTNARNRMASVVVSLDTSYAASAGISALQSASEVRQIWRREVPGDAAPIASEDFGAGRTRLLPSHGDFAVIYSSVEDSHSVELAYTHPDGGRIVHGLFSFKLATAIQNGETVTVRHVADILSTSDNQADTGQRFRVEASNPEFAVIADKAGMPRTDPIVVTSPPQMRGAATVKGDSVEIEGAINWSAPVRAVLINGVSAELRPGERFRAKRHLRPGINPIQIVALTGDARTHIKTIELRFEGNVEALAGEGTRYAVVIANKSYDYARTGFEPLKTPFDDADAVIDVLEQSYGFETKAVAKGQEFSLVLKDATRRDIETVLYKIGTIAGENDTVLIYYAGHGIYEERTTIAFWVPVDAETGVPISYVSATAISEAIQRMQARKVVVISDSCFSGEMLRGGKAVSRAEALVDRDTVLMRLAGKRTRLLVSSGGNEPVADGGGDGHSIFAQALLTGLREMNHRAFSARELFDDFVFPLVTLHARQEPQFRPLDQTGHDGGDLVFVRVEPHPKDGSRH